jgi:hypothetical protein
MVGWWISISCGGHWAWSPGLIHGQGKLCPYRTDGFPIACPLFTRRNNCPFMNEWDACKPTVFFFFQITSQAQPGDRWGGDPARSFMYHTSFFNQNIGNESECKTSVVRLTFITADAQALCLHSGVFVLPKSILQIKNIFP